MKYQIGDVIEVKFILRNDEAIVFGEVLNVNEFKVRMLIWDAPGSLNDWTEINIHKHDIIDVTQRSENVDYSELGLATH